MRQFYRTGFNGKKKKTLPPECDGG